MQPNDPSSQFNPLLNETTGVLANDSSDPIINGSPEPLWRRWDMTNTTYIPEMIPGPDNPRYIYFNFLFIKLEIILFL